MVFGNRKHELAGFAYRVSIPIMVKQSPGGSPSSLKLVEWTIVSI